MPILGFDHYNLNTTAAELERLRDFYRDVIGLVEGARPTFRRPGYWLYAGGAPVLHLSHSDDPRHAANPPCGAFDHVAFRCEGFEAMCANLDAHRVPYRIGAVASLNLRQIFLHDSTGNGVELNFPAT